MSPFLPESRIVPLVVHVSIPHSGRSALPTLTLPQFHHPILETWLVLGSPRDVGYRATGLLVSVLVSSSSLFRIGADGLVTARNADPAGGGSGLCPEAGQRRQHRSLLLR